MPTVTIPATITIPTPHYEPRARGIHARGVLSTNVRVRVGYTDRDIILKACRLLGTTESGFLRWCALHTAAQLLKDIDSGGTDPP